MFDYSVISGSSKLYLERLRRIPTYRGPTAVTSPNRHPVHSAVVSQPLPASQFVSTGSPPPDTAMADDPWPAGGTE